MASVTPRRTKIVATIGPACSTVEKVRELVEAGMDAARLNLSHGTHEDHAARAKLVRDVQEEIGRPLALIGDLQGPKFRVGGLDAAARPASQGDGGHRRRRATTELGTASFRLRRRRSARSCSPGHEVLIADGLIRLRVERGRVRPRSLRVVVGGVVTSHKGVNLPGVPIPIPSLTRKDLDDLEFALKLGCRLHRALVRPLGRRRPRPAAR